MITIKELLNRIRYDKRLNADDFLVYYLDRVSDELVEIGYKDIIRTEGSFMVLERDGEEVEIPLHRIRAVKEKNKVVWKRQL